MKPLHRRDFLKLAGLLSLGYTLPHFAGAARPQRQPARPQNVLIVVFDAFSAENSSLYGYPRRTTPNLERLADRAIVYHNHTSGGNFTTPGTASLLTGTLPWTHRAFGIHDEVVGAIAGKSLFHAFSGYHRLAYSHNPLADTLLKQFMSAIENYTPFENLYLKRDFLAQSIFRRDADAAGVSVNRALKRSGEGYSYSLFLSQFYESFRKRNLDAYAADFPRGLPDWDDTNFFLLERAIDWTAQSLVAAPQPFLGYYHFYPPHDPYHTRVDFFDEFAGDGFRPVKKPPHVFREGRRPSRYPRSRREYDEFVLYVDAEFARLYERLERSGLLENTWLVLTSDHGELFERDILGHLTPVLFQPVIHVPLLIFPPGQRVRQDIYETTSAIDLLPTLMHVTAQKPPPWSEGRILPPFSDPDLDAGRDVFSLQVEGADSDGAVNKASAVLIRDRQKLQYFFGYEELDGGELIELYDLESDPHELNNLAGQQPAVAAELLSTLKARVEQTNQLYRQS